MIEKTNLLTLKELASEERHPLLFDTSIFGHYQSNKEGSGIIQERTLVIKENFEFLHLIEELVLNGAHFYITPSVSKEISRGAKCAQKKNIKRVGGYKTLPLLREIGNDCRERSKLARIFQDCDKILYLDERDTKNYKIIYEEIRNEYQLSQTDFDLLISVIAMAKEKRYFNIASNDRDICRATINILKRERISEEKIKFYIRESLFGFKKWGQK